MFQKGSGNWTQYRTLQPSVEIDFHDGQHGPREVPYYEAMASVRSRALEAIRDAHKNGVRYVLFTHGSSTSRIGATTARSEVRGLIRSKDATPYVVRGECIQHNSVFVAAIRPPAAGQASSRPRT